MPMKDFLEELRTKAWRTAGARYNASRRLRRRELFSTISLAMFSSVSVAIAFLQRVYSTIPGAPLDNYLTALAACLGVFILAISLMEWGAANGAKAETLHRNAEDLTAYHLKIAQRLAQLNDKVDITWENVEDLRKDYEVIKERCPHNHLPLDDLLFRANRRTASEFVTSDGKPLISWRMEQFVSFRWSILSVWYFGIFWTVIGVAIAAIFWRF